MLLDHRIRNHQNFWIMKAVYKNLHCPRKEISPLNRKCDQFISGQFHLWKTTIVKSILVSDLYIGWQFWVIIMAAATTFRGNEIKWSSSRNCWHCLLSVFREMNVSATKLLLLTWYCCFVSRKLKKIFFITDTPKLNTIINSHNYHGLNFTRYGRLKINLGQEEWHYEP